MKREITTSLANGCIEESNSPRPVADGCVLGSNVEQPRTGRGETGRRRDDIDDVSQSRRCAIGLFSLVFVGLVALSLPVHAGIEFAQPTIDLGRVQQGT